MNQPLNDAVLDVQNAETRYDAIVIGAGQAGGPLATALARAGRTTALIEREHVGGTCVNEGCTPMQRLGPYIIFIDPQLGRVVWASRRPAPRAT